MSQPIATNRAEVRNLWGDVLMVLYNKCIYTVPISPHHGDCQDLLRQYQLHTHCTVLDMTNLVSVPPASSQGEFPRSSMPKGTTLPEWWFCSPPRYPQTEPHFPFTTPPSYPTSYQSLGPKVPYHIVYPILYLILTTTL